MSGPTPGRTARRPTTGCRSSAARPGSGTPAASNTICTISCPSSRTSTSTTRDVQDALLDVARFWLDRGVDGFRLDTINFYFHSQGLEDNPALPPAERNDQTAPTVNPYNYQDHIYDKSRPENVAFLKRFRAVLDEYPAAAARRRGRRFAARPRSRRVLHRRRRPGAHVLRLRLPGAGKDQRRRTCRAVLERFGEVADRRLVVLGLLQPRRRAPRHALGAPARPTRTAYLKVVSALLMSLRGSVCIYQGEELGLGEADLAFEDLQDPYGIRFWPEFKGRDGCRTPMVWEADAPNAGFSTGRPWLPMPAAHVGAGGQPAGGRSGIRCSSTTAASSPSAAPIRRSPRATSTSSRPTTTSSSSPASSATSRSSAPSIWAPRTPRSIWATPTTLSADCPVTALPAQATGGKIKLGSYGAWFGRIA